jgi:hypothetical protein
VKRLLMLSLLLSLGACGESAEKGKAPAPLESEAAETEEYVALAPSASYEEAHAAAVAAIEHSAELGHAWSTSDDLLKQAVAAAADGDADQATRLADAARIQAELAARQAAIEETAWRERVLSD